jgi:hypothetical protein
MFARRACSPSLLAGCIRGAGEVEWFDAAEVAGVGDGEWAKVDGRENVSREDAVAALDVDASGGD